MSERDARSNMATLAQTFEQAIMKVILEYYEDHEQTRAKKDFIVVLWLHDRCYVHFRRKLDRENLDLAHIKRLRKRLAAGAKELRVPDRLVSFERY